jgi:transcriptional/translational regulatory protein YebC/TACO1
MRTLAEMKNLFDRSGGNLGSTGSTSYMFDKKGEIKVASKGGGAEDEILELIDLGADDVEDIEEEGQKKYLVDVESTQLASMSTKITQSGFTVESSEIIYKPNLLTPVTDKDQAEKVIAFTDRVEEMDDIQKVHANFDIPEDLL